MTHSRSRTQASKEIWLTSRSESPQPRWARRTPGSRWPRSACHGGTASEAWSCSMWVSQCGAYASFGPLPLTAKARRAKSNVVQKRTRCTGSSVCRGSVHAAPRGRNALGRDRPFLEELCQCATGVAAARAHLLGRSLEHDAAATVAAFRAHVDDPVRFGDDVEVVLDHHYRVARVHQAMRHVDQLLDVRHVQADGGLIEHIQRLHAARLGELAHHLDILRLAAGEGRALLAERQIPEADLLQELQATLERWMRGEELERLVDIHCQHLADALAAQLDRQRVGIEARTVARLAGDAHVGQEGHRDLLQPLAFALVAPAAPRVERKAARGPAAHARFRRIGEELPYLVPEADIGGGTGARRLADRRLVDFQDALDLLRALDGLAADRLLLDQRGVQHIARERRFARARDAGDGDQAAERNRDIDLLQVMQRGALHFDLFACAIAPRMQRVA